MRTICELYGILTTRLLGFIRSFDYGSDGVCPRLMLIRSLGKCPYSEAAKTPGIFLTWASGMFRPKVCTPLSWFGVLVWVELQLAVLPPRPPSVRSPSVHPPGANHVLGCSVGNRSPTASTVDEATLRQFGQALVLVDWAGHGPGPGPHS